MTPAIPLPPEFRLEHHVRVGSTNDEARRAAEAGAAPGLLVWADEQTGGRGRRGRQWHSPPGNLYLSALLDPGPDFARAAQLSFACALAVHDALAAHVPAGLLGLKWPNDVLLAERKVCGILLESGRLAGGRAYVIAGIGINLRHAPAHTDGLPAIALAETGAAPAPERLLGDLAPALGRWVAAWRSDGFAALRAGWCARPNSLGRRHRVRLPDEEFEGLALDLDDSGALVLRLDDRSERRVGSGEVFALADDADIGKAAARAERR